AWHRRSKAAAGVLIAAAHRRQTAAGVLIAAAHRRQSVAGVVPAAAHRPEITGDAIRVRNPEIIASAASDRRAINSRSYEIQRRTANQVHDVRVVGIISRRLQPQRAPPVRFELQWLAVRRAEKIHARCRARVSCARPRIGRAGRSLRAKRALRSLWASQANRTLRTVRADRALRTSRSLSAARTGRAL